MAYQGSGINRAVGTKQELFEATTYQNTTSYGLVDMATNFSGHKQKHGEKSSAGLSIASSNGTKQGVWYYTTTMWCNREAGTGTPPPQTGLPGPPPHRGIAGPNNLRGYSDEN